MVDLQIIITQAYQAHQSGHLTRARKLLLKRREPQALHLLGLVERKAGNFNKAAWLLTKAAKAGLKDHELAHNQGLVAKQRGLLKDAERFFRLAIKRQPDFLQAWLSLGRLLLDISCWRGAEEAYQQVLKLAPDNVNAHYGLGAALLGKGDAARAESMFTELLAGEDILASTKNHVRYMRGRARLELGETVNGYHDLVNAHNETNSPITLRTLANTLWLQGRQNVLTTLLNKASTTPNLISTVISIYREQGDIDSARRLVNRLTSSQKQESEIAAAIAWNEITAGEPMVARQILNRCQNQSSALFQAAKIACLLMQGEPKAALKLIHHMRKTDPLTQHWIAYEATALRLLGGNDPRRLNDFGSLVRCYKLPTPTGFASIEAFNDAFLSLLIAEHQAATHPLDQSVRFGTQTHRNLATLDHPVIHAYMAALSAPIQDYLDSIGVSTNHPLTQRNTGRFSIDNCWSVILADGGYHQDHVHPQGWISSTYYVAVEGIDDEQTRAGWLRFGLPPFMTQPQLSPGDWVQPRSGLLVLFPAYMWHGTLPINHHTQRVTAPFDITPQ